MPNLGTCYSEYYAVSENPFIVYKGGERQTRLDWSKGEWRVQGAEVLYRGRARFGMQWILPIVEDYDPASESGFQYFARKGGLPYSFAEVPGVHIPDIVEWFGEYLALRAVESWAQTMRA